MRGLSGLSYFVWAIVFHLDYIRYIAEALNTQVFLRREEPDIPFSFRYNVIQTSEQLNRVRARLLKQKFTVD